MWDWDRWGLYKTLLQLRCKLQYNVLSLAGEPSTCIYIFIQTSRTRVFFKISRAAPVPPSIFTLFPFQLPSLVLAARRCLHPCKLSSAKNTHKTCLGGEGYRFGGVGASGVGGFYSFGFGGVLCLVHLPTASPPPPFPNKCWF